MIHEIQNRQQLEMQQAQEHHKEANMQKPYKIDPKLLLCPLCQLTLQKPTTLACGHSFCHQCLMAAVSRKQSENTQGRALAMIPLCPKCLSVIWRPLSGLKENVVLSALAQRYGQARVNQPSPVILSLQTEAQFHILLECASTNSPLLPHCYSQVVFATAFIDEILEQQAQSNLVVIRWPHAKEGKGIAGRLIRPQTYHYQLKTGRYETVYRATFEGHYFATITDWEQLNLKVNSLTQQFGQIETSPLSLCQVQEVQSERPVSLQQMQPFFEVYDKLNNPVYLRQIAQLVDQKILHERNAPQKLIYCAMRLLRLSDKEVIGLAELMDDQTRWERIEDYLVKNASRAAVEIIKIDIPGNYPHALVFALLLLMVVFHLLPKWQSSTHDHV